MSERVWGCKIGGVVEEEKLLRQSDGLMRAAVEEAFRRLTSSEPQFTFSGWAATLTEGERAVVENREPDKDKIIADLREQLAICGVTS